MTLDVRKDNYEPSSRQLTRFANILNKATDRPKFIVDGYEIRQKRKFDDLLYADAQGWLSRYEATEQGGELFTPISCQYAHDVLADMNRTAPVVDNIGWAVSTLKRVRYQAYRQLQDDTQAHALVDYARTGIWLGYQASLWATNQNPEQMLGNHKIDDLLPVW